MPLQLSGDNSIVSQAVAETTRWNISVSDSFGTQVFRSPKAEPSRLVECHPKFHNKIRQAIKTLQFSIVEECLERAFAFYPFRSQTERDEWCSTILSEFGLVVEA